MVSAELHLWSQVQHHSNPTLQVFHAGDRFSGNTRILLACETHQILRFQLQNASVVEHPLSIFGPAKPAPCIPFHSASKFIIVRSSFWTSPHSASESLRAQLIVHATSLSHLLCSNMVYFDVLWIWFRTIAATVVLQNAPCPKTVANSNSYACKWEWLSWPISRVMSFTSQTCKIMQISMQCKHT